MKLYAVVDLMSGAPGDAHCFYSVWTNRNDALAEANFNEDRQLLSVVEIEADVSDGCLKFV